MDKNLKNIGNEMVRINWRSKNNAGELLNPLNRIIESTKLEYLLISEIDENKKDVLIEVSEYHFLLYELASQLNLSAFRAEQRISIALFENEKLKKEIELLKQNIKF